MKLMATTSRPLALYASALLGVFLAVRLECATEAYYSAQATVTQATTASRDLMTAREELENAFRRATGLSITDPLPTELPRSIYLARQSPGGQQMWTDILAAWQESEPYTHYETVIEEERVKIHWSLFRHWNIATVATAFPNMQQATQELHAQLPRVQLLHDLIEAQRMKTWTEN